MRSTLQHLITLQQLIVTVDRCRRDKDHNIVERWTETCTMEVSVNPQGLLRVAEQACRNRGGKSRSGPMTAKVVKRVRESAAPVWYEGTTHVQGASKLKGD